MAAPSVPSNARVPFGNISSVGSELFISGVTTLSGAGGANIAHGMQETSPRVVDGLQGATPTHAWFIPLTDGDYSSVALSVTDTNIVITGGPASGKLIAFALRR